MRLIDADAIMMEPLDKDFGVSVEFRSGFYLAASRIFNAPTVDPVRHGGWKEITYHNGCTFDYDCVCSICEKSGAPYYEYCPHCGAKMDICLNI